MKIKLGTRWEKFWTKRGVLEVYVEWRDLWVGVYVGPDAIYVCPLPLVVLRFSRGSKRDPMSILRDGHWVRGITEIPYPPSPDEYIPRLEDGS